MYGSSSASKNFSALAMSDDSFEPVRISRWPGLESFQEGDKTRFHGRDSEINELNRRISQRRLTVLFAQSGLGKTSLLRAGVFPKLRKSHLLPIYLRIVHGASAPHPVDQIRAAVAAELGCELPQEYELATWFHDIRKGPTGHMLSGVVPVLVFDQFEEVFTIGQIGTEERARSTEFLRQLSDLAEARPSATLEKAFENASENPENFDFENSSYRIVLSIREDFLPHLERGKQLMPSVMENRQSLDRLRGDKAILAVLNPGEGIVDESVAESVVRFVAGGGDSPLSELDIEPPLLSLVCQQLDLQRGEGPITAELLQGKREEIISDYYHSCFNGLPSNAQAAVEDLLVTDSGYRENIATETLDRKIGTPHIATLINRHLLHTETRNGISRVELTHDILTRIIVITRASRRERDTLICQHQQANEKRRRKIRNLAIVALIVISIALTAITGYAIREKGMAEDARSQTNILLKQQETLSSQLKQSADALSSTATELTSYLIGEKKVITLGTETITALIPEMERLQIAASNASNDREAVSYNFHSFRYHASEAYARIGKDDDALKQIAEARKLLLNLAPEKRDIAEADLLVREGEIISGIIRSSNIRNLEGKIETVQSLSKPFLEAIEILKNEPEQPALAAEYRWRRLRASNLLARIMQAANLLDDSITLYRENAALCETDFADDFEILRARAEAYDGISNIQRVGINEQNAEEHEPKIREAIESQEIALAIRESLWNGNNQPWITFDLCTSLANIGECLRLLAAATKEEEHYMNATEAMKKRLQLQKDLHEKDRGSILFTISYALAIKDVVIQEALPPHRSVQGDENDVKRWLDQLNQAVKLAPDNIYILKAHYEVMEKHTPGHPELPAAKSAYQHLRDHDSR